MQTILWWQQQLPLRRPIPFLDSNLSNGSPTPLSQEPVPKLTKLLVNVTIQGTFRAIKLVMSTENTVADLVAAVLSKEKKLIELESRNFFLCRRKADDDGGSDVKALSSTTCSAEIGNASRNTRIPWLTFMDILM
ncbi:hypothetical protein JRO89_XS01G0234000 [Xanthoceras sorbifolium]|uniref:DUF7054 domain-containing protein n=1 Tax=Xanthoceras sorbifolium TaxID=99658 RepID=A0ABQ8IKX9_9ROSI|nr:hypothetical protein JRO89_XS01G0234000 [Xanthoceras sorbifolium]